MVSVTSIQPQFLKLSIIANLRLLPENYRGITVITKNLEFLWEESRNHQVIAVIT